jgi:hypothetical protein
MRVLPRLIAVTSMLAALACEQRRDAAQPAHPPPPQQEARGGTFSLRDLALATAVDANVARLALPSSDIEAALAAAKPAERSRAKEHLGALDAARGGLERAVAAVAHPNEKRLAPRVGSAARRYVEQLAIAANAGTSGPELLAAREELGRAITAYRQSRFTWKLDAPEPVSAEREFAEARADVERAEGGFAPRSGAAGGVAPEVDLAAARTKAQAAITRAKAAAARLSANLREPAVRYAAAQEKVLTAVAALSRAPDAERSRAARAYNAAKVDALAATSDYFAALATR